MTDKEYYTEGMKACEVVAKSVHRAKWLPHELYEDVLATAYEGLVRAKDKYNAERGTIFNFGYNVALSYLSNIASVYRKKKRRIPFDLLTSIDTIATDWEGEELCGYDAIADDKYDDIERIDMSAMVEQVLSKIGEDRLVDVFIMLGSDFTIAEIEASGLYGKNLRARLGKARESILRVYGHPMRGKHNDDWGKATIGPRRKPRKPRASITAYSKKKKGE